MDIKPITNTFGGYPHSEQEIMSCTDPQRTWYMLRENLEQQLQYRTRQSKSLVYQGNSLLAGGKDLQKALQNGWRVETQIPKGIFRAGRVTLTRPQVTKEEADFLGWNLKK